MTKLPDLLQYRQNVDVAAIVVITKVDEFGRIDLFDITIVQLYRSIDFIKITEATDDRFVVELTIYRYNCKIWTIDQHKKKRWTDRTEINISF